MMRSRPPVFVGGTGRSGTTILARLLGQHHEYHAIPIEVRFIVDRRGLCDVITGKIEPKRFLKHLTNIWWNRSLRDGQTRGLHKVLEKDDFADAVERFATSVFDASLEASRHLISDLLDPLVSASGAAQWVEMTPANVARGNDLGQLVPEMKLIHIMRDGRDVACSVVRRHWGPDDPYDALEWWGERLINAHRACNELNEHNFLAIQLENLIDRDRQESLTQVLDFLGLASTPALTRFFDEKVTRDRSHIGRWRNEISEDDRVPFSSFYARTLEKIQETGAPYPT